MTATEVQYNADALYDPARPAIDVKVRAPGLDFWPKLPRTVSADGTSFPALNADRMGAFVEQAYATVKSDFWQAAEQIAEQRGLGRIQQEGRSGGWLVFMDGDPRSLPKCEAGPCSTDCQAGWLAAYRGMVEWTERYIADAPRQVRCLAQRLAIDAAGESAAARMFAFDRGKAAA